MLPLDQLALWVAAQTPEPSTLDTWMPLIQAVLGLIGSGLVALWSAYGLRWSRWVAQKTDSEFLGQVTYKAGILAASLYQTRVKRLKANGVWDEKAKEGLLKDAVTLLGAGLDQKKLEKLAGDMGVENLLRHSMEAAVLAEKKRAKAVEIPSDPTQG